MISIETNNKQDSRYYEESMPKYEFGIDSRVI